MVFLVVLVVVLAEIRAGLRQREALARRIKDTLEETALPLPTPRLVAAVVRRRSAQTEHQGRAVSAVLEFLRQ